MNALAALAVAALITAAPTPSACGVDDAQLTWGFKESFRSYISGTIANGEWTVADGASYATPDFSFADGTGSFEGGRGTLDFEGSITFTGHDGILNTTVANPSIELDGNSAALYLDVTGTTQEGAAIDEGHVRFATLDLGAATVTESPTGEVSIAAAPVTLTSDGAVAFGTYEAGETFDPITLSFSTGEGCVSEPAPTWLIGVGALVVAVAATVVLLLRRRVRARR